MAAKSDAPAPAEYKKGVISLPSFIVLQEQRPVRRTTCWHSYLATFIADTVGHFTHASVQEALSPLFALLINGMLTAGLLIAQKHCALLIFVHNCGRVVAGLTLVGQCKSLISTTNWVSQRDILRAGRYTATLMSSLCAVPPSFVGFSILVKDGADDVAVLARHPWVVVPMQISLAFDACVLLIMTYKMVKISSLLSSQEDHEIEDSFSRNILVTIVGFIASKAHAWYMDVLVLMLFMQEGWSYHTLAVCIAVISLAGAAGLVTLALLLAAIFTRNNRLTDGDLAHLGRKRFTSEADMRVLHQVWPWFALWWMCDAANCLEVGVGQMVVLMAGQEARDIPRLTRVRVLIWWLLSCLCGIIVRVVSVRRSTALLLEVEARDGREELAPPPVLQKVGSGFYRLPHDAQRTAVLGCVLVTNPMHHILDVQRALIRRGAFPRSAHPALQRVRTNIQIPELNFQNPMYDTTRAPVAQGRAQALHSSEDATPRAHQSVTISRASQVTPRERTPRGECILCFDGVGNFVLLPCGHAGFCGNCTLSLIEQGFICPIVSNKLCWAYGYPQIN